MTIYLQPMIFLKGTTMNIYVYHNHDLHLYTFNFLKHIYLFLFDFSIPKDTSVHVSSQVSPHSQVWSQNSTTSWQTPYQKLMSKAIGLPLNEIIKLSDVCITSYYDYLYFFVYIIKCLPLMWHNLFFHIHAY